MFKWIENTIKKYFFSIIFLNKFEASCDSLDAWAYDWFIHDQCPQQPRIMRHQGGGNVMFLTETLSSTILRPCQVT